jgi:hypothetical protein
VELELPLELRDTSVDTLDHKIALRVMKLMVRQRFYHFFVRIVRKFENSALHGQRHYA